MLRWVAVSILKPDYTHESLTVVVSFPCAIEDLARVVQDARHPEDLRLFPHIFVTNPQLTEYGITFIANPVWHPQAVTVCFDLSRVDGRVYALLAPQYVTQDMLVRTAAVPPGERLNVHVGNSGDPLAQDGADHLHLGAVVVFTQHAVSPQPVPALSVTLVSGAELQSDRGLPEPATDTHYCIVWCNRPRLYHVPSAPSASLAQGIASFLGVQHTDLVLVPAASRVTDVMVGGVPCSTVIAAFSRAEMDRAPSQAGILIDCRPLLRGWLCELCPRGLLDVAALQSRLDADAPMAWHTIVDGAPQRFGLLQVHAGQVLQAEYRPNVLDPVWPEGGTAAPVDGERRHDSPSVALYQADFYVFAQDFDPEHVRVFLTAPGSLLHAHEAVNSAREPEHRERAPRLVEVFPQPDETMGAAIAVPSWPLSRVPVLFKVCASTMRLFCRLAPSPVSRDDLLHLAGLSPASQLSVFISDSPHPLEPELRYVARAGDLIVAVAADLPHAPLCALPDMLMTAAGWAQHEVLPLPAGDSAMLILPTGAMLTTEPPARLPMLAAAALHIEPLSVYVHAVPRSLTCHQHIGHCIREVFLAVPRELLTQADCPHTCVVLDLRALWLGVVAASAPSTTFTPALVREQFQEICPQGLYVAVTRAQPLAGQGSDTGTFQNGEVVVVCFRRLSDSEGANSVGHAGNLSGHDPIPN